MMTGQYHGSRRGLALGLGLVVVLAGAAGVVARDGRREEPAGFRCGRPAVAAVEVFDVDGSRRWRRPLPARVTLSDTSPLADQARVYTSEGGLAAFDIHNGRPIWSTPIKGPVYSEWLDGDQVIAVAGTVTPDGTIVAVDAASGRTRWIYRIPGGRLLGEAMRTGDGGIAMLGPDGAVRVIDATDGHLRWDTAPVGPENPEIPVGMAAGGALVVVTHGGIMTAMNASNGRIRWETPVPVGSGPELVGDALVVVDTTVSQTLTLIGYRLDDGQRRWQMPLPLNTPPPLLLLEQALLVMRLGSLDHGTLVAVDAASGAVRWRTNLGPSLIRESAIGPDELVTMQATVDVKDTRLAVRRLGDGIVISDTPLHGYLANMVAAPDGGFYGVLSSLVTGDLSQQITVIRQGRPAWTARLVSQVQRPPAVLSQGGVAVQEADPECLPPAQRAGP